MCAHFPSPNASHYLFQQTHLNDTEVPLGTLVTYACPENYYFDNQIVPIFRSVDVLCDPDDGYLDVPDPWPVCMAGEGI